MEGVKKLPLSLKKQGEKFFITNLFPFEN
jgi:hypothetical protein